MAYKCSASKKLHSDAVIGGVIGGVIVFILILVGAYLLYKKKKEAKNQVSPVPDTPSIKVLPTESNQSIIGRSRNISCLNKNDTTPTQITQADLPWQNSIQTLNDT